MTDPFRGISRRRFLSGVAVLGATPFYSQIAALPGITSEHRWTGDNFEEAHARQRNPYALIRDTKVKKQHAPCDVVVVGGGISGLTVAYKLRDRNIILLERETQTGGVSKSDEWNGIPYSLGAAYIVHPAPDGAEELEAESQEKKNWDLLNELGVVPDARIASEGDSCVFTNTQTVPDLKVYSQENKEFFEAVAEGKKFPKIPPEDDQLVQDLDSISFKDFLKNSDLQQKLYGKTVGQISSEGRESIEYYFWGAFGTNTWETSAYHGLNFFAAEFTKILVFPGGNAFIARRLDERIRQHKPNMIQTGHYVLRIEPRKEGQGYSIYSLKDNELHWFQARAVVFAAPLFLSKILIPDMPEEQKQAIESFDYRSFVVANILLARPMTTIFAKDGEQHLRDGYELRRIHNVDVERQDPYSLSSRGAFSDVVVADFAKRAAQYAVLTVYRPYPYSQGRDRLRYLTYDHVESEMRHAVVEGFADHGLRESDILDIRLTRWGHPMIIPRPGQLADGVMKVASKSHDSLFFSHTDIHGAPAIENALAAAHAAVNEVTKLLG